MAEKINGKIDISIDMLSIFSIIKLDDSSAKLPATIDGWVMH
jgi:hypothetical protein